MTLQLAAGSFILSQAGLALIIGGDGISWVKDRAKNYFPNPIYKLCKYHLERNLKKVLYYHKEIQRWIRGLLQEEEIDKSLKKLQQNGVNPSNWTHLRRK